MGNEDMASPGDNRTKECRNMAVVMQLSRPGCSLHDFRSALVRDSACSAKLWQDHSRPGRPQCTGEDPQSPRPIDGLARHISGRDKSWQAGG